MCVCVCVARSGAAVPLVKGLALFLSFARKMSSFSAEYTTKRTDHANWEQPSRRRGTYFGMYAAPKEAIANTTPSKSSGGEGRRLANDSSAPPSASASTNRSRPRGGGEDTHSRTQRFLSRVSKKRISGKFSSDEIALFRRKNAELEEHLDSLQKNFDELEREHFIVQGEYQISQGNVEELNATIKVCVITRFWLPLLLGTMYSVTPLLRFKVHSPHVVPFIDLHHFEEHGGRKQTPEWAFNP